MQKKEVEIINKLGIHARAAAKLVALASRFSSDIHLSRADKKTTEVDAKSIMSVMLLAASKGTSIKIKAVGEDEKEAVKAIKLLVNNRFEEDE